MYGQRIIFGNGQLCDSCKDADTSEERTETGDNTPHPLISNCQVSISVHPRTDGDYGEAKSIT